MIINLDKIPKGFKKSNAVLYGTSTEDNEFSLKISNYYHDKSNNKELDLYLNQVNAYHNNEKIYLIYPYLSSFFEIFELKDYVPHDIIQEIKDKKTVLAINISYGGYFSIVDTVYSNLIIKENIDPNQVLLIMGSPDLKKYIEEVAQRYNLDVIKYECFFSMEYAVQHAISLYYQVSSDCRLNLIIPNLKNPLNNNFFEKKFINMTRLWRKHKGAILLLLAESNLLDHGYISFSQMNDWNKLYNEILSSFKNKEIHEKFKKSYEIKNKLPLIIDTTSFADLSKIGPSWSPFNPSMLPFYNNSYFSLVNETHFDENYPFFPTEKIFKAIFHKHPFVVVSTSGFLKGLKNMGYKTFAPFINEKYDEEVNESLRLLMIIDEVKRLCNLSPIELEEFKQECLKVTNYNFDVLMNKKSFLERLL